MSEIRASVGHRSSQSLALSNGNERAQNHKCEGMLESIVTSEGIFIPRETHKKNFARVVLKHTIFQFLLLRYFGFQIGLYIIFRALYART